MMSSKRKRDDENDLPDSAGRKKDAAAEPSSGSDRDGKKKPNQEQTQNQGAAPNSGTPKTCVHEVAKPPGFADELDEKIHGTIDSPAFTGEMARTFPFTLDPFQATSVACLERRESVLVSAHTSAGKTAVAEYAIAMAVRDKQRVVYTSPLKALSNQKFRELGEIFPDVGLMTGDVTLSPNAQCLVMTTEILRSMLYRGSQELRDVGWVVFDEIHYMENRERGVVWEETIIFLPPEVKMVFLSATMSNSREFADWICHLHKKPCHVVYTDYRPTPLQHFVFPVGGQGLYQVLDKSGIFKEDNFNKAAETFAADKAEATGKKKAGRFTEQGQQQQGRQRGNTRGTAGKGEKSDIYKIVRTIQENKFDPVIVFSFRRRECEALAMSIAKLDFNSKEEKELVASVYGNAVQLLSEEDRELPAVKQILPLLQKGIGVHHSGLLPILKELIEILFQEGLIKALFATETFAMGLNMPAKTVVFTATEKWDGEQNRMLSSGDYIQMSGRAGRRGKDENGVVIVMVDENLTLDKCRGMMIGKPLPLESSFRLTYYALLNLMARAEGQFNTEYVIAHSFHQFQHDRQVPEIQRRITELEKEVAKLDRESGMDESVAEYHRLRLSLAEKDIQMREQMFRPDRCMAFLLPGRLVHVKDGTEDWGWGVVVNVTKRATPNSSVTPGSNPVPGPASNAPPQAASYVLDTLLLCQAAAKEEDSTGLMLKPCPLDSRAGEMQVIPVQLTAVVAMSALRISLPKDLRPYEARQSVRLTLRELLSRHKEKEDMPQLDPVEDMGIRDEGFMALVKGIYQEEEQLRKHPLFKSGQEGQKLEVLKRKSEMQAEVQKLKMQTKESQLSQFKQELHNRSRVLRRLGQIDGEGIVQLKGRAACQLTTADELLATELMFDGAFNDLDACQVVALCSCFLPSEKSKETEGQNLREELKKPFQELRDKAQWIATVQLEEKIELDEEEFVESFRPTLMEVFFQWAKGVSFAEICEITDVFEGTIVRVARRLDELLNELRSASRAVGDTALEAKFEDASKTLHRGIMFANSLYLE